jgi:hypothetical protein
MDTDFFATTPCGKIAIRKIGKVGKNFRLYEAGWIDKEMTVMFFKGAEFRKAKSGKNKGLLSIIIKETMRTVYVAKSEC